jgi:methionine-rich copper-binding protein CopC
VIGAVIATVLAIAPSAWAHSRLLHTSPAASAAVTAPVCEVTLTFTEHVHQQFSVVVVSGPGGVSDSKGHVEAVDDVVHQAVYPLTSGSYTVEWRVVSAAAARCTCRAVGTDRSSTAVKRGPDHRTLVRALDASVARR